MSLRSLRSLGIALLLTVGAGLAVATPVEARSAGAGGRTISRPVQSSPGLLPSILQYMRNLLRKSGWGQDPNGFS
jgi:hypothetical protein